MSKPKDKPHWKKINIRTSEEVRATLQLVVARLNMRPELRRADSGLSQEIFVAASWLWMESLDPAELSAAIFPYIGAARTALDPPQGGRQGDAEKTGKTSKKGEPSTTPWSVASTKDRSTASDKESVVKPDPDDPTTGERQRVPPRRRK